jgi:HK97 family phage prohead protease
MEIERRFVKREDAEIRAIEDTDDEGRKKTKICGYFAKFNRYSELLGDFIEIIEPGFFREALKSSDPVDLFNHDPNYILGRASAGTLRIWEDNVGLAYECETPDTQTVRDLVLTPISRGDLKGNSFGFITRIDGDKWERREDGIWIRTLKADGCEELLDGSQVTFPAYPDTAIALRSRDTHVKRDPGLSARDDKGRGNDLSAYFLDLLAQETLARLKSDF